MKKYVWILVPIIIALIVVAVAQAASLTWTAPVQLRVDWSGQTAQMDSPLGRFVYIDRWSISAEPQQVLGVYPSAPVDIAIAGMQSFLIRKSPSGVPWMGSGWWNSICPTGPEFEINDSGQMVVTNTTTSNLEVDFGTEHGVVTGTLEAGQAFEGQAYGWSVFTLVRPTDSAVCAQAFYEPAVKDGRFFLPVVRAN